MMRRRDRPPKRQRKRKLCYTCDARTVHLYDHGFKRFICTGCEL